MIFSELLAVLLVSDSAIAACGKIRLLIFLVKRRKLESGLLIKLHFTINFKVGCLPLIS